MVSLGVLGFFVLIELYKLMLTLENFDGDLGYFAKKYQLPFENTDALFQAIAGYGLGSSSIALFGRVRGVIYTKATDVGADLSGKNEYGLEEDDKRNPACIADNVGDNVGDIAGMGAVLFGSFAESMCAALVLVASSHALENSWKALVATEWKTTVSFVVGCVTSILCVQTPFTVGLLWQFLIFKNHDLWRFLFGLLRAGM